jgi:aspartyl-tRNA(Asn)/glutamyl-tRNA(Gln) amidotransferase subunit C
MFTSDAIKKIADLSKISLTDEETKNFSTQLSKIMEMIDSLNELDLKDIEPLTSICDTSIRLRKDEAEITNKEELLLNTKSEAGCFVVPKVIE